MEYIEIIKSMLLVGLTFGFLGIGFFSVYSGSAKRKIVGFALCMAGFVSSYAVFSLYGNLLEFWELVGLGLGTIASLAAGAGITLVAIVSIWTRY